MSEIALSIRGLGKRYRIGQRPSLGTSALRKLYRKFVPRRKAVVSDPSAPQLPVAGTPEEFWALQDICADIPAGEVVGVLGRNGSGKSTLLKVLSRITPPTTGEVKIRGRLGSLLEVGTGFHPELTGRENIFLNGIILGMSRFEIARKLDEIVSFAGVEKFIDTPVKRYSSGMYVRLAFAVAAQLETEILILDEVLSVGDQAFQRRCLGKVDEVARSGRTVLIVSHNLPVIQSTCTTGMLLKEGRLVMHDSIGAVIRCYAEMDRQASGEQIWTDPARSPHFEDGSVYLRAIRALRTDGASSSHFDVDESFDIEVEYEVTRQQHKASIHLYFRSDVGQTTFVSMDNAYSPWKRMAQPIGVHKARCRVPAGLLSDGTVRIEYLICTNPTTSYYATERDALVLTITDEMRPSKVRSDWTREWPSALVRPTLEWEFDLERRAAKCA